MVPLELQLTKVLWVGHGTVPWEYVTLVLCRDIYHCGPRELKLQPVTEVIPHLTCLEVEARLQSLRSRKGLKMPPKLLGD